LDYGPLFRRSAILNLAAVCASGMPETRRTPQNTTEHCRTPQNAIENTAGHPV